MPKFSKAELTQMEERTRQIEMEREEKQKKRERKKRERKQKEKYSFIEKMVAPIMLLMTLLIAAVLWLVF